MLDWFFPPSHCFLIILLFFLFIDRLGRKPVILAASVVFTVGSIVMGAADGKEVLLAGRIVVGIGIGKECAVTWKCFPFLFLYVSWTTMERARVHWSPSSSVSVTRSNAVYRAASSSLALVGWWLIIWRVSSTLFFPHPFPFFFLKNDQPRRILSREPSEYQRNEENEIGGFQGPGMKRKKNSVSPDKRSL